MFSITTGIQNKVNVNINYISFSEGFENDI